MPPALRQQIYMCNVYRVYTYFYKFQPPVGTIFIGPIKTGPVSQTFFLNSEYWVKFPRVNRPGRGVDNLPLSNAEFMYG
jgi:hypothetical protein